MAANKTSGGAPGARRDFWVLLACLAVIMSVLFYKSFLPQYVLHNNDTPLGNIVQASAKLPQGIAGSWTDLNWPGGAYFFMQPMPTTLFRWWFGNFAWAKFWTPISQIILGLSAWLLFRRLKLAPAACVLGGLAAALQGDFFSNACWGQQSRPLAISAMLLALAALQGRRGWTSWLRVLLAGTSVGFGIMEGFDIAALFSIVVGVYALVQPWLEDGEKPLVKISTGVARAGLMAAFSAVVAAHMLQGLVGTSVKNVITGQNTESKAAHWAWATQWSLPKAETLSSLVPGLFGYRMDTPGGGQYWGTSGRDVAWDAYFANGKQGPQPHGFIRYGGAGCYSGPIIVMLGLFAIFQAGRRKDSPFSLAEKRSIWFWCGLWVICLLLAWGRFAPFYQFFYLLPYASTIRSPGKFYHICDWSLLILCGYGLHALAKQYWGNVVAAAVAGKNRFAAPARPSSFDRKWVIGSAVAMGVALVGWLIYGASGESLRRYLVEVQFDPDSAAQIAGYSIRQVGWFVLFLGLGLGVLGLSVRGQLSGSKARLGAILLGVVLVGDLARANLPWIVYWNWQQKYATNELFDQLREKSYEHRVGGLPPWFLEAFNFPHEAAGMQQYLDQFYRIQWLQHEFPFYDIQSVDIVQMPRPPEDFSTYETALSVRSGETLPLVARKWELTNTRYILALAGFADFFNRQLDPDKHRFQVAETFAITPKPGITEPRQLDEFTAVLTTNGPFALIDFTGALPRARLYANWEVSTNDDATLKKLADLSFDPWSAVLVADKISAPPAGVTNSDAGTVDFASYSPTDIKFKAKATAPAVLLFNDHYDPEWQVLVDGKKSELLRCNYIMRGVQLTPGDHAVEFVFVPDERALYITLAGLGLSLLAGLGVLLGRKKADAPASP